MLVLSFDCGIINLAWCLYDNSSKVILDWKVICVQRSSAVCATEALLKKMDLFVLPLIKQHKNVHVVIEQQPYRNAACKSVELALKSYFVIRGMIDTNGHVAAIKIYKPKYKLAGIKVQKGKKGYDDRKAKSIELVSALAVVKSSKWNTFLADLKKKDDVCDALLQALSYCERSVSDNAASDQPAIRARKPVSLENLTKAGCKYLLRQLLYPRLKKQRVGALQRLPTEVNSQPHLKKAVITHFGSLDDALVLTGLK